MQRVLSIPLFAFALIACEASVAESDVHGDSCWEALLTCADTELHEGSPSSSPTKPTISQTVKDAGRWAKERVVRHVRVDRASYPQRPHTGPST